MDATEVLQQLNATWSSMLDKFYDSVEDEMISWISKEHNIPITTLRAKAAPLKEKLLSKATEAVNSVKSTKKAEMKPKTKDGSKYGKMIRKELVELSKERNLPVKRKNQDMIDALKKYDEVHETDDEVHETDDGVHETDDGVRETNTLENESDVEPEIQLKEEPVSVKKIKKLLPKAPKKTSIPLTETLVEETISDEDD